MGSIMNITLTLTLAYLVVMLGFSFYYSRRNVGTKDYFIAKGDLGVVMVTSLIFAEIIAGAVTVGAATTGFTTGLSSVWVNWGCMVGIVLFLLISANFFRAMNRIKGAMTIPICYEYLFSRRCRLVMLFVTVLSYLILFSTQPVAVASIFSGILGVDKTVVIWACGIIFVLMAIFSGLKGIAVMNIINSLLLYIGMTVVAFQSVKQAGGLGVIHATLPSTYFDVFQPDFATAFGGGIATAFATIAGSSYANAASAAKSRKVNYISQGLAGLLLIPFSFLAPLVGMAGKVLMPGSAAGGILYTMANSISPFLGALACMAVLAACFSTGPSFLFLGITNLTRDLYREFIRPDATEKQELRWHKTMTAIAGIAFVYFGSTNSSLLTQILGAFQIRSVVGITLAFGILWPRMTEKSAFWSMLLGGIVATFWFFAGNPFGVAPFWPAALVTVVIVFAASITSKEVVSPGYLRYREIMKEADVLEAESGH